MASGAKGGAPANEVSVLSYGVAETVTELDPFVEMAMELADVASGLSLKIWGGDLTVTYKSDGSSLTDADVTIEERWREAIRRRFPSHGILGEEFGTDTGQSPFTWVLDPIDGTRQFGAGLLNYASLISLCCDGVPVLGVIDLPVPNMRYVAAKGRGTQFAGRLVHTSARTELGSCVISLANPDSFSGPSAAAYNAFRTLGRTRVFDGGSPAYGALARGLIDICVNGDDLDAYDICALCPIVKEAGGAITDWTGKDLTLNSSGGIAASATAELHAAVLRETSLHR